MIVSDDVVLRKRIVDVEAATSVDQIFVNDGGTLKQITKEQFIKLLGLNTMVGPSARISEVTLLASAWVGDVSPYSQVVNIEGVTENSQVDLTPSADQLEAFRQKELTLTTKNVGGVVTVYAIGQKPTNDYTIQVTITEVDYE